MKELTQDQKIRANRACNGDKTIPLTKEEADYCLKRMRADGKTSSEVAKVLGLSAYEVDRWIIAGYALGGRPGSQPPVVDEPLPPTIREKLRVPKKTARPQVAVVDDSTAVEDTDADKDREIVEYLRSGSSAPVQLDVAKPPAEPSEADERQAQLPKTISEAVPTVRNVGAEMESPGTDPLIPAALKVMAKAAALAEAERALEEAEQASQLAYEELLEAIHAPFKLASDQTEVPAAVAVDSVEGGVDYAAVRAWAKQNGIAVRETGRIKAEVVEAYREANPS